jgi:hypothetical protein
MIRKDLIGNSRAVRILFFLISPFLLYLPVLQKYFVSDDFKVLDRVCVQQILLAGRFFRPLSDLTIFLNYQIDGFDPVIFNSFNLLVHGVNCLLLYECCLKIGITGDRTANQSFAFIGATLFLSYPFHNEGVVWLLGRGASMACAFALGGILILFSDMGLLKKTLLTCACYASALLAYESIVFFPFIVLVLFTLRPTSKKEKILCFCGLLITLGMHLIVRVLVAGSLTGPYGEGFFRLSPLNYLLNIPRTAIRLVLPPTGGHPLLFVIYGIVLTAIVFAGVLLAGRLAGKPYAMAMKVLFVCLCIACITPVVSGLSLRTSETDRMLYFPSVFYCMILAWLLTRIARPFFKFLVCCSLLAYNIFFLEENNFHWSVAGETTQSLVNLAKGRASGSKMYIFDIPEEYKGAYIFRQGLNDALRMNSIDVSGIVAVNYLRPEQNGLPPLSTLQPPLPMPDRKDELIYWNRRFFVRLPKERQNNPR